MAALRGSELLERIVVLEQSTKAAHKRLDERDQDIKDIKNGVGEVAQEVKEVVAYMNRGKGWAAAVVVMAGLLGAFFKELISSWFRSKT